MKLSEFLFFVSEFYSKTAAIEILKNKSSCKNNDAVLLFDNPGRWIVYIDSIVNKQFCLGDFYKSEFALLNVIKLS